MTKTAIKEIARKSKTLFGGHGLSVFADGTSLNAISSNDITHRGKQGGWEQRLTYIDRPMTVKQVAEAVGE